ncbi:MAG: hypothetical protein ACOCUW_04530, partial [Gemmatimonadota bacterium]
MARSELAKRWAVALVGIPTAVALAWIGRWGLGPVLAFFCALAALELYRLAGARGIDPLRWPGALAGAALVMLAAAYPAVPAFAPVAWTFVIAFLLVVAALAIGRRRTDGRPLMVVAVTTLGAVLPGGAMSFLI